MLANRGRSNNERTYTNVRSTKRTYSPRRPRRAFASFCAQKASLPQQHFHDRLYPILVAICTKSKCSSHKIEYRLLNKAD